MAIQNIFSGALIPLVFFPDWLQALAAVLPFQGMISTPALIYLGKMDAPTTAFMLGFQAVWAVGLIMLGRLVWRGAVSSGDDQWRLSPRGRLHAAAGWSTSTSAASASR